MNTRGEGGGQLCVAVSHLPLKTCLMHTSGSDQMLSYTFVSLTLVRVNPTGASDT